MNDTPEMDRLIDRLFNDPTRELVHLHVSWGPKAHELTTEERAAVLNRALDDTGEPVDNIDEYGGGKPTP